MPGKKKTGIPFDWKWIITFAIGFLLQFATLMWKGGAIQADLLNLQKQQDHTQAVIDRYFGPK